MKRIADGTGLFTLAQALGWGFTRPEIRAHVRNGRWIRLRRGVYVKHADRQVAARRPDTLHAQDVRAVQLAMSRHQVVGADTSAARILGIDLYPEPPLEIVLLTDDCGVSSTHRDGYFLRVAPLPGEHLSTRHGTPITSPARTLLDVSANHGFDCGVVATESAYRKRLITPAEFGSLIDSSVGRPGIQLAREVHAFANPLTESVLETVSRLSFRKAGIVQPDVQVVIVKFPEVRVDFFWSWLRLVGEGDGMRKYEMDGRQPMVELKRQRDREQQIRDAGCDIVRWDWRVANSPKLLAARVLPAMERAEARLRGQAS